MNWKRNDLDSRCSCRCKGASVIPETCCISPPRFVTNVRLRCQNARRRRALVGIVYIGEMIEIRGSPLRQTAMVRNSYQLRLVKYVDVQNFLLSS
jgi:hypothetical protein